MTKPKTKKQKALESLKKGKFKVVAEAARDAGLADPSCLWKHIYKYGGFDEWLKKGAPYDLPKAP